MGSTRRSKPKTLKIPAHLRNLAEDVAAEEEWKRNRMSAMPKTNLAEPKVEKEPPKTAELIRLEEKVDALRKPYVMEVQAPPDEQRRLQMEHDRALRGIYDLALLGYKDSAKPKQTQKKTRSKSRKSSQVEFKQETTTEQRVGDPRFLHVALAATQQIADLHGLKAPAKVTHSNPDGSPLKMEHIHKQLEQASVEDLKALRLANRAVMRLTGSPTPEPIDAEFEVKNVDTSASPPSGADDVPDGERSSDEGPVGGTADAGPGDGGL